MQSCEKNSLREVHIFDVCGTLFREDTTVGLLRWHLRRRGQTIKSLTLEALFSRRSPLNLLMRILERVSGRHLAKHLAIGLLAGEPLSELEASAQEYAGHLLQSKTVASVFERLLVAQRAKSQVILASASLEPLIRAVSQRLRVQGIGSQLGVSSGCLTGKLERDLTGRKVDALAEAFGADLFSGQAFGYSDNLSDLELLLKCDHRLVVLHGPRERSRWHLPEAHFVELSWGQDLPENSS